METLDGVSPASAPRDPGEEVDGPPAPPTLILVWSIPALLMGLQMYLGAWIGRTPAPPPAALLPAVAEWLIWVPLTPIVLRLAERFPPGWPLPPVHGAVHLGAIVGASFLRGLVYAGATLAIGGATADGLAGYWRRIGIGWVPISAVVYGAILAAGQALGWARRSRAEAIRSARLEARLARAELGALRAHLHPHFLFNSLHAVGALVRSNEREAAVRTIAELSHLLRELLRPDAPDEVPLAEELGFVRRYLDLVALRFGDRIRVEWNIEAGMDRALVPRMALQPLVENAIRHGIGVLGDAGRVHIAVARHDRELELRVTDDGPGPGEGVAPDSSGTGLAALRARLRGHFGADAQVSLARAAPRGAVATVRLPFRLAPP